MTSASPPLERLSSWGRDRWTRSRRHVPGSPAGAGEALRSGGVTGVIARGFGRSYGDPCLNDGGDVIDATALTAVQELDLAGGAVVAGAGLSYRDLVRRCLPAGWFPPVCPGTAFVSLGGALAQDVHGKNQHVAGSFGDHVEWFDLLLPDGSVRRVAPTEDRTLFEGTVGGLGLTGIVLALRLRLAPVPSNAVELEELRCDGLDALLDALGREDARWPYTVAWIDALTRGRGFGRGIVERARHVTDMVGELGDWSLPVPLDLPGWLLNPATVGAFNAWYYRRVPSGGRRRRVHVNRFLFPLDRLRDWNRMYGRRGVLQFQCVVPFAAGEPAVRALLDAATASRGASFLAVLKRMDRHGRGMLSFPMPGFSLAMDFPRHRETADLVRRLYRIAIDFGGRAYLAKDAVLDAKGLAAMYPRLPEFLALRRQVDPTDRLQSDMARRLGLLTSRPAVGA